jgi:hypothetical protein
MRSTILVAALALCGVSGCVVRTYAHGTPTYSEVHYRYMGAHPLSDGHEWCFMEYEHVHDYAPVYSDYTYRGGVYVYARPSLLWYVGYHPVPTGGYCSLQGRHSHHYHPGSAYANDYTWDHSQRVYVYRNAPPPGRVVVPSGPPPGRSPGYAPPPAYNPPPGHGGVPPGHGGTPPGHNDVPPPGHINNPGHGGHVHPGHSGGPPGHHEDRASKVGGPPGHGGPPGRGGRDDDGHGHDDGRGRGKDSNDDRGSQGASSNPGQGKGPQKGQGKGDDDKGGKGKDARGAPPGRNR